MILRSLPGQPRLGLILWIAVVEGDFETAAPPALARTGASLTRIARRLSLGSAPTFEPAGAATSWAQVTPRFHQAGFVRACFCNHEKWCWADRLKSGSVANPTRAHRRVPGRRSRMIERAEAAPQTCRSTLYVGRLEELRPSALVRIGIPSLLGFQGQRKKWTSTPARAAPDHAASNLSHRLSPRAARRIHTGI